MVLCVIKQIIEIIHLVAGQSISSRAESLFSVIICLLIKSDN